MAPLTSQRPFAGGAVHGQCLLLNGFCKSALTHKSATGSPFAHLQVVPSTAIGFTLYDYCKSALALPTNL